MSKTLKELLDRGDVVVIQRNALDSYTACAFSPESVHAGAVRCAIALAFDCDDEDDDGQLVSSITDHFTPEEALQGIVDKRFGVGEYAAEKSE